MNDVTSETKLADAKLARWIEENIGGTVTRLERQPRWRPSWFADVEKDGKLLPLYIRGQRIDFLPPCPVDEEAKILQILEAHDIPVPHVYGMCKDPHAIIMANVPGKGTLSKAANEAERVSVLEHLAELMVKVRAIDPKEFEAAGLKVPTSREESALCVFKPCEEIYRRVKVRPEPPIEFVIAWLKRNAPKRASKPALQQADSGQFLFENGKVTALHDYEYACLGDPYLDLAALRFRAIYASMGDLRPLFHRYAELRDEPLDRFDFCYQAIEWHVTNAMQGVVPVATQPVDGNYPEIMSWYVCGMHCVYQAMAEAIGVKLEIPPPMTPQPSRWGSVHAIIEQRAPAWDKRLTPEGLDGTEEDYKKLVDHDLAVYARRLDVYRDELEAEYLAEAADILGRPVQGWVETDRQLEAFVMTCGPEYDKRLFRMFFRWNYRLMELVRGLGADNRMMYEWFQPLDELGIK